MTAYYNEIDPYAAAWLRNLIKAGHIAPGDVDERSIMEVSADDVRNYTQCHWFAGIGGWSYALRLAGWDDTRPVWTGSCPCQPFSVAGKGKAQSDERHLWPAWFNLIKSVQPPVVFGEQVAGAIAHGWLDDAFDDLEGQGYETAACVLPACSVGAPHKRDRLWFVADTGSAGRGTGLLRNSGDDGKPLGSGRPVIAAESGEAPAFMARAEPYVDDSESRRRRFWNAEDERQTSGAEHPSGDAGENVADTNNKGSQRWNGAELPECSGEQFAGPGGSHDVSDAEGNGHRERRRESHLHQADGGSDGELLSEPSISNWWSIEPPLGRVANGIPARAHKLRAYGNAIVPQVAAEFIKAYLG